MLCSIYDHDDYNLQFIAMTSTLKIFKCSNSQLALLTFYLEGPMHKIWPYWHCNASWKRAYKKTGGGNCEKRGSVCMHACDYNCAVLTSSGCQWGWFPGRTPWSGLQWRSVEGWRSESYWWLSAQLGHLLVTPSPLSTGTTHYRLQEHTDINYTHSSPESAKKNAEQMYSVTWSHSP